MAVSEKRPPLEKAAGRYAIIGAITGFVITTIVVILGAMSQGEGIGGATGLGLFVGIWGGGGFGAMVGAAIAAMRDTDWFT